MLTSQEEVREFRRVVASFPYFLSTYVYLADGGGTKFTPWPWQLRLAEVWRSRKQVIILKARQLGVSWLAAAYALWTALTQRGRWCCWCRRRKRMRWSCSRRCSSSLITCRPF